MPRNAGVGSMIYTTWGGAIADRGLFTRLMRANARIYHKADAIVLQQMWDLGYKKDAEAIANAPDGCHYEVVDGKGEYICGEQEE